MSATGFGLGSGVPDFGEVIQRERLVSAHVRLRPRMVVINAPAGYGKSVLAAQFATHGSYDWTVWVDAEGRLNPTKVVIEALAGILGGQEHPALSTLNRANGDVADLVSALMDSARAGTLGRGCIVVDDIGSPVDESFAALCGTLSIGGRTSLTVVLTARAAVQLGRGAVHCRVLGADDMRFTSTETRALVSVATGGMASDETAADIHQASNGQPALVSVLACSLATVEQGSFRLDEPTASMSALVHDLAERQLDDAGRRLLETAALLGEGSLRQLAHVLDDDAAVSMLERVGAIIPLVRVTTEGGNTRFRVHDIARSMFGCAAEYSLALPLCWQRLVRLAFDDGRAPQGVALLLAADDLRQLPDYLVEHGAELARLGHHDLLRRALAAVPAPQIVQRPRLLLLKATVEWDAGRLYEATRSATSSRDIAELEEDSQCHLDATLLLALVQSAAGDFVQVRECLRKVDASVRKTAASGTRAGVLAYLVLASAILCDEAELFQVCEEAVSVARSEKLQPGMQARLRVNLALADILYRGDLQSAMSHFDSVAQAPDVPLGLRNVTRGNRATVLLELGRLEQARIENVRYAEWSRMCGFKSCEHAAQAAAHGIAMTLGSATVDSTVILESAERCMEMGESSLAVLILLFNAAATRASGDADTSLLLAERALTALADLCMPAIAWLARLEHAASMLALGDVHFAARRVSRIHDEVSGTAANGHHLKADLILAVIDCRNGSVDLAVDRLREHVAYILTESPNWQLAMYIRAFPELLGPVASVVGAASLPVHMLKMILPEYAERAVAGARGLLPQSELELLSSRLEMPQPAGRRPSEVERSESCVVRMFGGLHVEVAGRSIEDREWRKRKARLLFAMLATRCGKDISRDQVVEYLWPEMDDDQALNNLYVVWSCMKRALTPDLRRGQACPYVEHRGGICRAIAGTMTTDIDEFEAQLNVAAKARSARDADSEIAALLRISELYIGELLPGELYDDWFVSLRERCRHDFEDAMLRASALLEERGDPVGGLALVRRALHHDPWREDLYQAAIRLQASVGQRSAAIETYLACRSRLVEDLGIDPSAETTRLYQQVLCMEDGGSTRQQ